MEIRWIDWQAALGLGTTNAHNSVNTQRCFFSGPFQLFGKVRSMMFGSGGTGRRLRLVGPDTSFEMLLKMALGAT